MRLDRLAAAVLVGLSGSVVAQRIDVTIAAARDVTLYQDPAGQLTNDAGPSLFLGTDANGIARRLLLAFDIAAHVPPNAHIVFAQLQLTVAQSPAGAVPIDVSVHRLLSDWPEGTTVAAGTGGAGSAAHPGDTTWTHRPTPSTPWNVPGGDYVTTPSDTFAMPTSGIFALGSSAGLVRDVQAWLNGAVPNDGWLLKTDELSPQTVRRLHSRQTPFVGVNPQLQIGYVRSGTSYDRGPGCIGSNGRFLHQTILGVPVASTVASVFATDGIPNMLTATLMSSTFGQTLVHILPGCPYELSDIWYDNLGPMLLDPQGQVIYTFVVPNIPAIIGQTMSFQTAAIDPGAPQLITFSNGSLVVFG